MKNYASILKTSYIVFIVIVLSTLQSCDPDDGVDIIAMPEPEVIEKTIFGKWEITSGKLILENSKYVYINEDNSINILAEDNLSFKNDYRTNITVSENQFVTGNTIYNFVINEDLLTIVRPGGSEVKLSRNNDIPQEANWVRYLSIIEESNISWSGFSDIGFNGTHILSGNSSYGPNINLINPSTFDKDGEITTSQYASAVEIEKYDGLNRYVFQSDSRNSKFKAFYESSNVEAFESIDFGDTINGLASVDSTSVWVSSHSQKSIYLYKYTGTPEILTTIELDFSPVGLDYQNGFLYISDGFRIHKCTTSPNLVALESYRIENHRIHGIAYDGTNFWLNGSEYVFTGQKLLKIDLQAI